MKKLALVLAVLSINATTHHVAADDYLAVRRAEMIRAADTVKNIAMHGSDLEFKLFDDAFTRYDDTILAWGYKLGADACGMHFNLLGFKLNPGVSTRLIGVVVAAYYGYQYMKNSKQKDSDAKKAEEAQTPSETFAQ